jgi:hypothetical protein
MSLSDQPGYFQVLFEYALQDYERQTGITLANHPLAERLQTCQSAESVTALLQEQARALSQFRESDKIMGSLKNVVSVLSKISATAALGQDFGTVCLRLPIECSTDPINAYSIVIPTCGCDKYWPRYTAYCMGLISFYVRLSNVQVSQAFEGVTSDSEAAIELLESMEIFLNRLDIYTKVPPTPAMTEIVVKIIVELLSTLALVTSQIRQRRSSEFVFASILPGSTQCREICKGAFRRE